MNTILKCLASILYSSLTYLQSFLNYSESVYSAFKFKQTFKQSTALWPKLVYMSGILFVLLAQAPGVAAQLVTGHVLEEYSRDPVPNAVVRLQNLEREEVKHTTTNEYGFFAIRAPEAAEYFIHVNRISYTENTGGPFFVNKEDTLGVQIRVMKISTIMDEVMVTAERIQESLETQHMRQNGFYLRKEKGLGEFMGREEIEEKNPVSTQDLFRSVPGVKVQDGQIWSYRTQESCPLKIVLNGMEVTNPSSLTLIGSQSRPAFSIDALVHPDDIIGIEVYTSTIGQPVQFGRKTRCGLVLIWTR